MPGAVLSVTHITSLLHLRCFLKYISGNSRLARYSEREKNTMVINIKFEKIPRTVTIPSSTVGIHSAYYIKGL